MYSETLIPRITDTKAYGANTAAIHRHVGSTRYSYIVAWGKWLGFTPEAVHQQLQQAEADNAPDDSIQKVNGRWLSLDDIACESNRRRVIELA